MKKYWKLSRWGVFEDPLEKSILVVAWLTCDKFIRYQKIKYFLLVEEYSLWLNEGFKKKLKFEFLVDLHAKQYDFR